MPRQRKSPTERARRRTAVQKRYRQTLKGHSAINRAKRDYQSRQRTALIHGQAQASETVLERIARITRGG